MRSNRDSIWQRYSSLLKLENESVTLGEGNTPLVISRGIGPSVGCDQLVFKVESANPTGSYKDRFVAFEVAQALTQHQEVCIATSSGNTGSSLAAYAARYGLACHVFVNEQTPDGKLQQMLAYGAQVYRIRGFGSSAVETMEVFGQLELRAEQKNCRLVVSAFRYSPIGMQGVKTLAYEIAYQFGVPNHVFVPVGGGGLLTAVCNGFRDCLAAGKTQTLPKIHAVQPAGAATVVRSLLAGSGEIKPIDADTKISGLAVPFDIDGSLALAAVRESGGQGLAVTDSEIWEAQELLFRHEGINAEPAGAASVAGFLKALQRGSISCHETAVCLITGHGFKDPVSIERMNSTGSIPLIEMQDIHPWFESLR